MVPQTTTANNNGYCYTSSNIIFPSIIFDGSHMSQTIKSKIFSINHLHFISSDKCLNPAKTSDILLSGVIRYSMYLIHLKCILFVLQFQFYSLLSELLLQNILMRYLGFGFNWNETKCFPVDKNNIDTRYPREEWV